MLPESTIAFGEVNRLSEKDAIDDAYGHAVRLLDISAQTFLERDIVETTLNVLSLYRSSRIFALAREVAYYAAGKRLKEKTIELFDLERSIAKKLGLTNFTELKGGEKIGLLQHNNFGILIPYWSGRIIHDVDGQEPVQIELCRINRVYDEKEGRSKMLPLDYVPVLRIMQDLTVQVPFLAEKLSKTPNFHIACIASTFGPKSTSR